MNKIGQNNLENREVWLEKILADIKNGESIIDVGAGELQYKKLCNHLNYTSQDFGGYNGLGNSEGFQTKTWDNSRLDIISDISNIPVPNSSFDNAMCIEVLEHVPNPVAAIKEISRIIKPGGKIIITAPFCSLTHMAPFFFQTGLSKYWYEKVLDNEGFKIINISNNGNYFEYLAQEFRRLPEMTMLHSKLTLKDRVIYKISSFLLLNLLNKWSANNKKSEEVLCFGLHIMAIKK